MKVKIKSRNCQEDCKNKRVEVFLQKEKLQQVKIAKPAEPQSKAENTMQEEDIRGPDTLSQAEDDGETLVIEKKGNPFPPMFYSKPTNDDSENDVAEAHSNSESSEKGLMDELFSQIDDMVARSPTVNGDSDFPSFSGGDKAGENDFSDAVALIDVAQDVSIFRSDLCNEISGDMTEGMLLDDGDLTASEVKFRTRFMGRDEDGNVIELDEEIAQGEELVSYDPESGKPSRVCGRISKPAMVSAISPSEMV